MITNTKDFIEKSKQIHNNKYDYSKTDYINSHIKVIIICPEHGEFLQIPNNHLNNHGCYKCIHLNSKKDFVKKAKQIHNNKYDYSKTDYISGQKKIIIICSEHGEFLQTPKSHLQNIGCPKCGRIKANEKRKVSNKIAELKSFYNKQIKTFDATPLFSEKEYIGTKNKSYKWKCKKCNKNFVDNIFNGSRPLCKFCFPRNNGKSLIEKEIQDWSKINNFSIETNKRFYYDKHKFYELDIFIPEKNIGIELNGLYWHSEISGNKNKNYHLDKTNYFEKLNIQILHIWDSEWTCKQNIVKSIILNKLGLTENKIYGRQCEIKLINNNKLVNDFLNNNHLQKYSPCSIKLGLFFNNELVSLLTFSKSRFNKNYEYEITRFCNKLNTNVIGGFSKLLKYFINNYNSHSIITYADKRYSNGNLYKNNGFNLLHESTPNYFYTKNYKFLESRNKYQKHKLFNLLENFNPNLTEWENMKMHKFDRVWDCGNYVFELKKRGSKTSS